MGEIILLSICLMYATAVKVKVDTRLGIMLSII